MPTLFKNGKNYSGTSVSLTQAEYDALTETQKNDGTVYFITDSDAVLDASDVALGSGTVETLAGSIATIETSPATANHSIGDYIVYNGQLYKVTTAITAGTTLTGKVSAVSVGEELKYAISEILTASIPIAGLSPNATSTATVSFSKTYATVPNLILTQGGRDRFSVGWTALTTTGATISARNVSTDTLATGSSDLKVTVFVIGN